MIVVDPDSKVTITRRGLFLAGAAALLSQHNQAAGPPLNLITLSPSPKDLETSVEAYIKRRDCPNGVSKVT